MRYGIRMPALWKLALVTMAIVAVGWGARGLSSLNLSPSPALLTNAMMAERDYPARPEMRASPLGLTDRRPPNRPFLGITYLPLTAGAASEYGVDVDWGVLVTAVAAGGPADLAGIRPGDVVLYFEDQPLVPEASLLDLLWRAQPGASVKLVLLRQGRCLTANAVLGSR
ncbi:MAG: PDZ domain-containing protein [Chloroflexi bacterium]|nr:PDZ domain-containing protein [Chloroflexota bacterium]